MPVASIEPASLPVWVAVAVEVNQTRPASNGSRRKWW